MSQPVETIIIRAQESFDVVHGLDIVQIEIEDDRIINILKNTKIFCIKLTSSLTISCFINKCHITYLLQGKR